MKLTKAMKEQLLYYIEDAVADGSYYGNVDEYFKRHDKIKEWVKEQEVGK